MEAKPDFVVVAVNRNSVWSVAREWIKAGFPVLLETPVGHTEEELKEAWEMSLHGAKIQVAEQYHRYPILAAGIKAVKEGLIGDPDPPDVKYRTDGNDPSWKSVPQPGDSD